MRKILHVITREDPLLDEVIQAQRPFPETEVRLIDLRNEAPDYERLVTEIFRADSIICW